MSRGSQLFLFQSSQLFLSRGSQVSVSRGSQVSVSPGSQVSVSWGFQVFVSRGSQVSVSPGSQVSLQHCGVAAAGSAPGPRSRWHSAGGHSRFPVEFPIPAFPLSSHPPINACDWDQTRPVSVRRVPVLQGAHTCECPYHRCAHTTGVPAPQVCPHIPLRTGISADALFPLLPVTESKVQSSTMQKASKAQSNKTKPNQTKQKAKTPTPKNEGTKKPNKP